MRDTFLTCVSFNTRTGGGILCTTDHSTCFFAKKLKTAHPPNLAYLRTAQEYMLCANFNFIEQKVRWPSQLSEMCPPGSASNLKIVVHGHSFSPNVFNLSGWNIGVATYECIFRILLFRDLKFRSIFDPAHYKLREGGITLLTITFEPKVIDEWNRYQSVCLLVTPNRMIPNMTNFDLIWHVTSNLAGGQILKFGFGQN